MQNLFKFDKLNFITAGMPLRTGKGSYVSAFGVLEEMNLDGMELEFVHGVRMNNEHRTFVKEKSNNNYYHLIDFITLCLIHITFTHIFQMLS